MPSESYISGGSHPSADSAIAAVLASSWLCPAHPETNLTMVIALFGWGTTGDVPLPRNGQHLESSSDQFLVAAPTVVPVRNSFTAFVVPAVASSLLTTVVPRSTQGSFRS